MRRRFGPPLALLAFALTVRLVFFSGMHVSDDLYYRIHAHDLLAGEFTPDSHFKARVGFIVPLALCERLFGVNDLSGALFPMACGLLGVMSVYWIGCMLASRAAGIIAGIMAATVPNSIFWGGLAQTDIPAAAFMTLSAAFFIRACRAPDRWAPVAAGLALGMAYLQRESAVLLGAFFIAAWLFRRVSFRQLLIAGVGFAAVLGVEMIYFTAVMGDPLGRFHATTGASFSPTVLEAYTPHLGRRLTYKIPSMLFNPLDDFAPYFGLLFPLAAVAAVVLLWKREKSVLLPLIWWASLFLVMMYIPFYLSPYRPAVIAHPKNLEPLTAAAAVVIGLWAVGARGKWRILSWGAVAGTAAIGLAAAMVNMHASSLRTKGPELAYEKIQEKGGRCFTDPRTAELFAYWGGFPEPRRAEPFRDEMPSGSLVVVDDHWIAFLEEYYGYKPPAIPDRWEEIYGVVTEPRQSIRALLMGRRVRIGQGWMTRVYRVTD